VGYRILNIEHSVRELDNDTIQKLKENAQTALDSPKWRQIFSE